MKAKPFLSLATGLFLLIAVNSFSQYPPPAGQPGSTAVFKDSSVFTTWAKSCVVERGFIDVSDTTVVYAGSNRASVGVDGNAMGIADDQVVSLGDGGTATLTFEGYIYNGSGFDFAVFENGFGDEFLELGFVEVSSDGIRFVRFPSVSLTQTTSQVLTFGALDATKINNLAGKYRFFFGTPFDLEELKDSSSIDIDHITHIRIRDVVGTINPAYATYDHQGHRINDPWPTPFNSCGFDLDAVGVIHFTPLGVEGKAGNARISCYPNPSSGRLFFTSTGPESGLAFIRLTDLSGRKVAEFECTGRSGMIPLDDQPGGIYIASFVFRDGVTVPLKIIRN